MKTRWIQLVFLTLSIAGLLLASGCGGSTTDPTLDEQAPGLATEEGWAGSSTLRDTSGAPSGVRIIWNVVDDETVVGYHVYKSDLPIPDSARGQSSYWLDNDGTPVFDQPTSSDVTELSVDDVFTVNLGEIYYYRVSSLATDGSESLLSPELVVTISDFSISGLSTTSVPGGTDFTIYGENFGLYDYAVDEVHVRGAEWVWGSGFIIADLQCPVIDWQPEAITVTLPLGATSGRVEVTVNGVTQSSLDSVMNSNPFITHCSPLTVDPGDTITLSGNHFGGPVNADNHVVFGTLAMTNSESYSLYGGDMIMFEAPSLPAGLYEVTVFVDDAESNIAYIEIGDTNGPAWGHTWGTSATDVGTAIAAGDTTDCYVAGYSIGLSANPIDTLIIKYDAGTLVWAQYWNNTDNTDAGTREESLNDICYYDGYVYAVGGCQDETGTPCTLLLCYSDDGVFQYARRWGSGSVNMAFAQAIVCDGTNLYIAGSLMDADSELLLLNYTTDGTFVSAQSWNPTANFEVGFDLTIDSAGDLIATGTTVDAFSTSSDDVFVLKTDTSFQKSWGVYWGTNDIDTPMVLTTDQSNNILLGGSSAYFLNPEVVPFILTLDSTGTVVSEYEWDVTGSATFVGLDFASTGDLYAVISRWPGVDDVMFLSIDPADFSANLGWQFYSDTYLPIGYDSTINNLDDVLFCGSSTMMSGDWSTFTLSGTVIDEGTQYLAETGTELSSSTGSPSDLTGTGGAAIGTEDSGAGGEDLLVHAINPV